MHIYIEVTLYFFLDTWADPGLGYWACQHAPYDSVLHTIEFSLFTGESDHLLPPIDLHMPRALWAHKQISASSDWSLLSDRSGVQEVSETAVHPAFLPPLTPPPVQHWIQILELCKIRGCSHSSCWSADELSKLWQDLCLHVSELRNFTAFVLHKEGGL